MLFTGNNLLFYNELPSTNAWAWQLLPLRPPEGTVVQTHNQTNGRGQAGSQWEVTAGENITLSIIYYPNFINSKDIFALNKLVALAVLRTVRNSLSPADEAQIKWPNDILVNKRKIAGILIENQWEGSGLKASIIGIGLNVNQVHFSPEVSAKATSLALVAGHAFDTNELRTQLLSEVEAAYLLLRRGGRDHIAADYLQELWGYHEEVQLLLDGISQVRTILGVDTSGKLAISGDQEGTIRLLDIKEATFIVA